MEGDNVEQNETLQESGNTLTERDERSVDNLTVDDIKFKDEEDVSVESNEEVESSEEPNEDTDSVRPDAIDPQPGQEEEAADAEPEVDAPNQFADLSKETGFEIGSKDDVVKILKEYAQVKDKDPLEGLDPEIQEVIKAKKAGMDLNHFFSVRSMDFEKLDGKEVMKQKFLRDHASLAKENPDFANKRFEREYKAKYGDLSRTFEDEEEKEQFMAEHAEDLEYAKMELDHEIKAAREELTKWQKETTTIPEPTEATPSGLTPEDEAKLVEKYNAQVEEYFTGFKGVEIPLDGDKNFTLGFDGDMAAKIKETAMNPTKFLNDIGFNENGIDLEKFAPIVALLENSDKLGKLISDHALEMRNKETFTNELENPRATGATNSGTPGIRSLAEQIADEFESKY